MAATPAFLAEQLTKVGVSGSTVLLLIVAFLKRRWHLTDQRRSSYRALRNLARLYKEAYYRQNDYLKGISADIRIAFDLRAQGNNAQADAQFSLINLKLRESPDFLRIVKNEKPDEISDDDMGRETRNVSQDDFDELFSKLEDK